MAATPVCGVCSVCSVWLAWPDSGVAPSTIVRSRRRIRRRVAPRRRRHPSLPAPRAVTLEYVLIIACLLFIAVLLAVRVL